MKAKVGSGLFQSSKDFHREIQSKKETNKQTNKAVAFTTEDPTTAAETYIISCLQSDLLPENKHCGEREAASLFHPMVMVLVEKITER